MEQPTFDPVEENLLLRRWVNRLSEILIAGQKLLGLLTDNPRAITPEEHHQVMEETGSVYPALTVNLRRKFPTLTDADIFLCCLIRLHFVIPEIAIIMKVDAKSVSRRKLRIKAQMRKVLPDMWKEETSLDYFIHNSQDEPQGIVEQNHWLRAEEKRLLKLLIGGNKPEYLSADKHKVFFLNLDRLYPGFIDCLRNPLLKLTFNDLLTCCLIKLRFSISDIAIMTGIATASVTTRKRRIQEKIETMQPGIWEKYPSLNAWIYMLG
jgi:hypothetical protein